MHMCLSVCSGQDDYVCIGIQCISGCLSRRDKKWELALFVQITTAE